MSDEKRELEGQEELTEEELEEIASMMKNKIYRDHTRAAVTQLAFDIGLLCGLIRDPGLTEAMNNSVAFHNALIGAWMDSAPEPTELVEKLCDSFILTRIQKSGFGPSDFEEDENEEEANK